MRGQISWIYFSSGSLGKHQYCPRLPNKMKNAAALPFPISLKVSGERAATPQGCQGSPSTGRRDTVMQRNSETLLPTRTFIHTYKVQKKRDSDVKWQASSSSEVCFVAQEHGWSRHCVLQGWGLGLHRLRCRASTWSSVIQDALVSFCKCTLLAVGGLAIIPPKETDHQHLYLHQHMENNPKHTHAWCFVQNVRQLIRVGLKVNPHESTWQALGPKTDSKKRESSRDATCVRN